MNKNTTFPRYTNPDVGPYAPPSMPRQKDFQDHDHRAPAMVHHNSQLLREKGPVLSEQNYYRVHGGQ